MILLLGFYTDEVPERTREFVECVRRNLEHPHIERIALFIEDLTFPTASLGPFVDHPKIITIHHGRRVTYQDLFDYSNTHFKGAGIIIANADIYFDETLGHVSYLSLEGRMLCLSRWDEHPDGSHRLLHRADSQDAWIFQAPLPKLSGDFHLGKPGCDNRIAYEAERAGLALSNPSLTLRIKHLHTSDVRRYRQIDRVHGPVRMIDCTTLVPAPPIRFPPEFPDFSSHRAVRQGKAIESRMLKIEEDLQHHYGQYLTHALRVELRLAFGAKYSSQVPLSDAPLALVRFREEMGYTLARVETGISTHNNDRRPFVAIPNSIRSLTFTQLVSNCAGPVNVEFVSTGILIVGVARGWEGYAVAAEFLSGAGWPMQTETKTSDGTEFDLWTLYARQGERFTVPTQVMLISCELIAAERLMLSL